MFSRRDFLQVSCATVGLLGFGTDFVRASARQTLTQDDLLNFESVGNVTITHITDIHAQLVPIYFREPSINLGVGEMSGLPPHITGKEFLEKFGIEKGTASAYSLSSSDFTALARDYGRVGGVDRLSTLLNHIRAERPGKTLFLDGGDTWQGSYTSLKTGGADMVKIMNALKTDAMTAHWEFTYGQERVNELLEELSFDFLAGNIRDTEWDEPAFEATSYFERGGVKIAVIGQAFPYTPIANPRYKIPDWSFGIREDEVQAHVDKARAQGAELVILLSHNGFDVDRKLVSRVSGIDVVLTGHTHDALPVAIDVNGTLLIASGSHGKFLSRLDLDVRDGQVKDYRYKLIPVLSDVIEPDPAMTALVTEIRQPHQQEINKVLGTTESLLYRRGNLNGTFDDLICDALLSERDAEIALSPGFRWGASLLPGQEITVDDVYNMTAITYPNAYRNEMTGETLKNILEDVADNLFNEDPYYQQGGDMVRVGGMGYHINPNAQMGSRISNMTLLKTGEKIDASKPYIVSGWASVNEDVQGPAIYDVVSDYISKQKTVTVNPHNAVKLRKS
ncbi:thiosulfohydrolase SoxB [Sneathiella sp.]|jgi:sulfur-oxidizing protein SoxB|uniref:thiosulfohydrolase SoxB n=1 Tax=Sneathiella sp. TaxID=1964365 RepID=UPI0039E6B374